MRASIHDLHAGETTHLTAIAKSAVGLNRILCGIAMLLGTSWLVGCDAGPVRVPVHGRVLYQGQPLTFGSVMFQPLGSGEIARSTIAPDGTYTLTTRSEGDGVLPARCRVRVTCYEGQQQALQSGAQEQSLGRLLIPSRYTRFGTSGIEVDVSPDMQLPLVLELQ